MLTSMHWEEQVVHPEYIECFGPFGNMLVIIHSRSPFVQQAFHKKSAEEMRWFAWAHRSISCLQQPHVEVYDFVIDPLPGF